MKSFDEVFDALPDFDLCDAICGSIEQCYGYDHLTSWPDDVPVVFRVVHCIWSTTGGSLCEGYARFFSLDCDHGGYPRSMRAIGIVDVAEAIEESLALVPVDCLGFTHGLIEHFGSWEALCETVDRHEELLFKSSSRIEAALAAYVRDHKDEFRGLMPHLIDQRKWQVGA